MMKLCFISMVQWTEIFQEWSYTTPDWAEDIYQQWSDRYGVVCHAWHNFRTILFFFSRCHYKHKWECPLWYWYCI